MKFQNLQRQTVIEILMIEPDAGVTHHKYPFICDYADVPARVRRETEVLCIVKGDRYELQNFLDSQPNFRGRSTVLNRPEFSVPTINRRIHRLKDTSLLIAQTIARNHPLHRAIFEDSAAGEVQTMEDILPQIDHIVAVIVHRLAAQQHFCLTMNRFAT
jgi:hypothetical protein